MFQSNGRKVLTDEEKLINPHESKQKYNQKMKDDLTVCKNDNILLRNQILFLCTQRDEQKTAQAQLQITNEQLNIEIEEHRRTISQLREEVSTCRDDIREKDQALSSCHGDIREKDLAILHLRDELSVSTSQLQEIVHTLSQLNLENNNLKIYRDLVIELNSKYPKLLPSFVYEIQQPDNPASSPEVNTWARSQVESLTPTGVISLSAFKSITPAPISNIPCVSMKTDHCAFSDNQFQRWLYLWRQNREDSNDYKNLYQILRRRYEVSPVQIIKQYG